MKGIRNHVKNGSMLLVSITHDHTLKSRMMGNYQVRFGSGGGEGDFFANHHHHELSRRAAHAQGRRGEVPLTPARASGLTDHVWSVRELLTFRVPPPAWVEPKRRGRHRTTIVSASTPAAARCRPLLRLRKGVFCSSTGYGSSTPEDLPREVSIRSLVEAERRKSKKRLKNKLPDDQETLF